MDKVDKSDTPMADKLELNRKLLGQIRTPAYGDALKKLREAERLLRGILPGWVDTIQASEKCDVCCEITNKEVIEIRDFLNR